MTEDYPDTADDSTEALARLFGKLSAEDQELVLALVARLQSRSPEAADEEPFERDVPFMDFEE